MAGSAEEGEAAGSAEGGAAAAAGLGEAGEADWEEEDWAAVD